MSSVRNGRTMVVMRTVKYEKKYDNLFLKKYSLKGTILIIFLSNPLIQKNPQNNNKKMLRRFSNLIFQESSPTTTRKLPHNFSQADDDRANLEVLLMEEIENRDDTIEECQTIYRALEKAFFQGIAVVTAKESVARQQKQHHAREQEEDWDMKAKVTHHMYFRMYDVFFRQMKTLLRQNFRFIFPRGLANLSADDVTGVVSMWALTEIALMDNDAESFAFVLVPGEVNRLSIKNCPEDKRYTYHVFMAFKSLIGQLKKEGGAALDLFRRSITESFFTGVVVKQNNNISPPNLVPTAGNSTSSPLGGAAVIQEGNAPFSSLLLTLPASVRERLQLLMFALKNALLPIAKNELFPRFALDFYIFASSIDQSLSCLPLMDAAGQGEGGGGHSNHNQPVIVSSSTN